MGGEVTRRRNKVSLPLNFSFSSLHIPFYFGFMDTMNSGLFVCFNRLLFTLLYTSVKVSDVLYKRVVI